MSEMPVGKLLNKMNLKILKSNTNKHKTRLSKEILKYKEQRVFQKQI